MSFPIDDPRWVQALDFARDNIKAGDAVFAQHQFITFLPRALPYVYLTRKSLRKSDWIIFQKSYVPQFGRRIMRHVKENFMPLFANEEFVIFMNRNSHALKNGGKGFAAPPVAEAVWEELKRIEKESPPVDKKRPNQLFFHLRSAYAPPAAPVRFARNLARSIFSPRELVLTISRGGGFFSNFNVVMSHLAGSLNHEGIRSMRVEWDVAQINNDPNFPEGHNFPYGRPEDGNLWEHFFEQFPARGGSRLREVRSFGFKDLRITYIYAHYLYKSNGAWRRKYHDAYRRHIRIQPHIQRKVDALYSTHMAGKHAIGLHVRNDAHKSEHLSGQSVTFANHIEKINAAIAAAPGEVVIFLATDVEEIADKFRAVYGDRLFLQPGVVRMAGSQTGEKDHQLHHKNPNPSLKLGEDVLIDALLLSKCDTFIHGASNLATAVGYINPGLRMVYCE